LMDEVEHIRAELQILLARYDFLVLSGGVSKGKFDYVPQVLEELGVTQLFHRVQQKPGKPFWFGYSPSTVVFALPGNPVSTFMCVYRYVQPWLRASLGLAPLQPTYAVLEETFHFKPNLTHFLQVRLRYAPNGICYARPLKGKGSGDLTNLNEVDGFLELSAESDTFEAGTAHPVWQFR
ncbi:MAG: molybdopterin-binding protein, partial [Bacteroidota bacterium]